MSDTVASGEIMQPGAEYVSSSGKAFFVFQEDGNLVLYAKRGEQWLARWDSHTAGSGANKCQMQEDGNLVLYRGSRSLWDSRSYGHPGASLVVQDDENVVIYEGANALWSTDTWVRFVPVGPDRPDPAQPGPSGTDEVPEDRVVYVYDEGHPGGGGGKPILPRPIAED